MVNKPSSAAVTKIGIAVRKQNGTYNSGWSRYDDAQIQSVGKTNKEFYFDLNVELGLTLEPGTSYCYKLYAVVGGSEFWSEERTIKTTGTHPHKYERRYEGAHPHKVYMKCECGDWYYTGEFETMTNCSACLESNARKFSDVAVGSYYEQAVGWAVGNKITNGVTETKFSPDGTCTRAQAVTFLWRAAGCPAPKITYIPFSDVKPGSYYASAVMWAVENGITNGTGKNLFSPDDNCSRAQIVSLIWRAQGSPASGTANPFTDVKSSAYYAGAVMWAVKSGITLGTGKTEFSPNNNCTRAQIVTFIWRASANK